MGNSKSYRVIWQADIDADTPEEAAELILKSIINKEFNVFSLYEWQPGPKYEPVCFLELDTSVGKVIDDVVPPPYVF
jgi:hypothetical protein